MYNLQGFCCHFSLEWPNNFGLLRIPVATRKITFYRDPSSNVNAPIVRWYLNCLRLKLAIDCCHQMVEYVVKCCQMICPSLEIIFKYIHSGTRYGMYICVLYHVIGEWYLSVAIVETKELLTWFRDPSRSDCMCCFTFRFCAAAIGLCIFCDAPRTLEGRLAAIGQRHLVKDIRWKLMWVFPKMVVPNNHGFSY